MKKRMTWVGLSRVLSLGFLLFSEFGASGQGVPVGGLARDFTVTDRRTGSPVRLRDFEGSIVLLDFFAYWCGPCVRSSPDVERNIRQHYLAAGGNPSGIPVVVLSVNIEETNPGATDSFVRSAGLETVVNDFTGSAYDQFATGGIPLFVVINGASNATTHKAWEVLYRGAGYPGAMALRAKIDSVKAASLGPVLTGQPTDLEVTIGGTARFSVTVQGAGPYTYAWRRDRVPIPAATNAVFTIPSARATDAAAYSVVVSGPSGSSISREARLTVTTGSTPPPAGSGFPDPALEAAVRQALGIPNRSLTVADLLTLKSLVSPASNGRRIVDLRGLDRATGLVTLDLTGHDLIDLSPLSKLSQLQNLVLNQNSRLASLTPVGGLAGLRSLQLRETGITDAGPLAGATQLVELDLASTRVRDAGPVAGLRFLRKLTLNDTGVTRLEPLAGLGNLTSLYVSGTGVTDFSVLPRLPLLANLSVARTRPSDFRWLAGLKAVSAVDLSFTELPSLDLVPRLAELTWLSVSGNPLRDLSRLREAVRLDHLAIGSLDLETLPELPPPAGVLSLDISANRLRNLTRLSGAVKTGYLYAQGNQVEDLAPLLELPGLRQVYLESNWLDLGPGGRGAEQVSQLKARGVVVGVSRQSFGVAARAVRRPRPGIAVELRGRAGKEVDVYRSANLLDWNYFARVPLGQGETEFQDSGGGGARWFYQFQPVP
jgi:Leucine-rich repeat (LRR) protein